MQTFDTPRFARLAAFLVLVVASTATLAQERISLTDTGAAPTCPPPTGSEVPDDDGNYETTNECNRHPHLSYDDRYIAFVSEAALVAADTNGVADVYLHDRNDGSLQLISVSTSGAIANGPSSYPFVTSVTGGAVVAFLSEATNLDDTLADANGFEDVFIRDTVLDTTIRIRDAAVEPDGAACIDEISGKAPLDKCRPAISGDGNLVAFASTASNFGPPVNPGLDLWLYNRTTGGFELLSVDPMGDPTGGPDGDGGISHSPEFSENGLFVGFTSMAKDLVAGIPPTVGSHAFRRDLTTDTTILLSLNSAGEDLDRASSAPVLTATGDLAAFMTGSTNIDMLDNDTRSDIFLRDPVTGTTTRVSLTNTGEANNTVDRGASISSGGSFVSWWIDTINNGGRGGIGHVFVRDRLSSETILVTAGANGNSWDSVISSDGTFVVTTSMANNFGVADAGKTADIYLLPVDREVTGSGVDLAIVVENDNTLLAGEMVTYSIDVTNAGPDDALGATVNATFPAQLGNVSWTCAAQSGGDCAVSGGSGNINTTVDVPVAGSILFTVTATVQGSGGDTVSVSANVTAASGDTDLNTDNNSDSDVEQIFDEDIIFFSGFEEL